MDIGAPDTPRWVQRFDNFGRTLRDVRDVVRLRQERPLSLLENQGLIQRFELSTEMGWKVMGDFLRDDGVVLPVSSPKAIVRAAFMAGLIADGDGWMEAIEDRNATSHVYDEERFQRTIDHVVERYLPMFEALNGALSKILEERFGHA